MDAFTLTAASGVKLKLSKGPVKQVAVRDVQLSWGPGTRASGLFNFIVSRGPRVRVTLNGVRLQLASPPTATSGATPFPEATPSPTAPATGAANSEPNKEHPSTKEDSAQPSIYLLNLIILELHDVAVVDEAQNVLATVTECHLSATTQQQTLTMSGLSIPPPQKEKETGKENQQQHDLVSLDNVTVQHNGPLIALRRSSATNTLPLQKIVLELGTAVVCLHPDVVIQTSSLLTRFKKPKSAVSSVPLPAVLVSRTSSTPHSGMITENSSSSGGLLNLRRRSFDVGSRMGSTTSSTNPLVSKLQALPREVVLQMTRIHVSGTSEEGLYGVFALDSGIATCQVASSTAGTGAELVTGTATWQKMSCSVAPDVSAPPGVELQCSSSEIGLTASPSDAVLSNVALGGSIKSGGAAGAATNTAMVVDGRVKINAMHTRIKHWDLQELVERLPKLSIGKKKKKENINNPSTSTSPSSSAAAAASTLAISSYKFSMSLGEGSSLQFLDGDSECMWLSSLHSADLTIDRTAAAPTTASTSTGVGVSFQATEIAMTTAQVGPHLNVEVDNFNKFALEKVLAAKLVRIVYSPPLQLPPPPALFSASSATAASTSPSPFDVKESDSTTTSSTGQGVCDITTESVHAVLHPASVGALADVSRALAALKTAAAPIKPAAAAVPSATSGSVSSGSGAPIPGNKTIGVEEKKAKRPLPKLTFNISNTLLIAPATVTIPAAHSSIGRIQLVHSTLGASLATAVGSIQISGGTTGSSVGDKGRKEKYTSSSSSSSSSGSAGTGEVSLSDLSVVYSESLAAQKFPEDAQNFKSYVKSTVIGLRNGTFAQESTIHFTSEDGPGGGGGASNNTSTGSAASASSLYKRKFKLDQLTAVADADAMGCAIQAADDILAMYQLLKASTRHNNSWSRLRSTTTPSSQQESTLVPEPSSNSTPGERSTRVSLTGFGMSGSELDAVDIVTLNELSRAAAAAVGDGGGGGDVNGEEFSENDYYNEKASYKSSSSSGSKIQKKKIPVYIDITALKFSLPLSADIEVSLEVDAVHAELAPARGVHLVRTEAMNLTMKGKTVLRWNELAASLHTATSPNSETSHGAASATTAATASVIPLQPLHPMRRSKPGDTTTRTTIGGFTRRSSMAASLSREMSLANDWSIHTSPGNSPRAKAAGGGGGSSGSGHRRQTQWPTGVSTGTSTLLDGAPAPTADLGAEEDALPSGLLPYHRAGVSPWLRQGATTSNKSPQNEPSTSSHASSGANKDSFPGKDDDTEAQKAEYLGSGPRSSLDLHLCGFEFIVPYDREPGPTQRYAEMYFKAVSAAFTHSVKVLRKKTQQSSSNKSTGAETGAGSLVSEIVSGGISSPARTGTGTGMGTTSSVKSKPSHSTVKSVASSLFPLQLNLRVDGFSFRFEHHPMEKWLAIHGPLLRQAALQEFLWEEAVANVQNVADVAASPLHAGIVESGIAPSSAAIAAAAAAAAAAGGAVGVNASAVGGGTSTGPSSLHNEEVLVHDAKTVTSGGATAGGATTTATSNIAPSSEAGSSHSGGAAGGGGAASSSSGGGLGGDPGKEHAWEGLIRTLAAQYKAEAIKAAAAAAAAARKPGGNTTGSAAASISHSSLLNTMPCDDLLLISCDVIQILTVVCDTKSTVAHDAALRHITRLDPTSTGVELMGARKLHIDIVAHSFAFHIASSPQPFIKSSCLVISGPIAIAKQRTAPPTTTSRTLAVGGHRAVEIQTNVRGCKAPFKVYTDVNIDAKRLCVVFSPGYEPALAMMGMAGKRLAPSDPDKSAPRPPPVPWWDDLRYLWRGKAKIHATPFRVLLSAHQLPTVDETSERMTIRASSAEIFLTPEGDHSINFNGLSCSLYQDAGVEAPGGALLMLPFIHAPVAKLRMKLGWKLPKGRNPQNHHLFPAVVPSEKNSSVQAPILVAQEYKAEGLDVALEVYFGQGAVSTSNGAGSGSGQGGPQLISALTSSSGGAGLAGASGTALGFLGDRQIAFLRDFSRNMKSTPAHIKACAKRGTFFARKPRGGPPKKGLPRLLQLFKLSISASPLEIVHFTTDPTDPSAGLRIGASSASFGAAWLLNQPMPSFLQLPPHVRKNSNNPSAASAAAGQKPPSSSGSGPAATRTITQDFFLNLGDISMHRDDPNDDFFLPESPGNGKLGAGTGGVGYTTTTTTTAAAGDASSDPLNNPFASDPYSLGHKGLAAAAAAANNNNSSSSYADQARGGHASFGDYDDPDLEEGARHAAALLQTLVERRREATAKDNSLLSATTLTVSRRPKPNSPDDGDDDDDGGGGGGGDDPNIDPISAAFGQRKARPLRVVVSNCRFLMDLGTRNAVWGAVSHMVAAFAAKPKTGRGGAGAGGGGNGGGSFSPYAGGAAGGGFPGAGTPRVTGRLLSPLGSLLSPAAIAARQRDSAAEVHRRISTNTPPTTTPGQQQMLVRASSTNSEIGATPETNELLSLLLQQREAAGGEIGSALPTPHASAGDEISSSDGGGDHYGGNGAGGGYTDGTEEEGIEGDAPMTTPLDDVHSVLRYEVEVNDLQVMMLTSTEAGPGPGRLLLAAKSGRLRGLTLPDGLVPLQITTLGLEDVQAYVSITDVDPHVSLSWLHVDKNGFSALEDGGPAALRRVFNPISIDMRHSKAPSSSLTTRRAGSVMSARPMSLRSPTPGGGFGAAMMKTDELILKIPEIAAVMDGKEFEVVADVVSLLLTPGPSITTITAEEKLLGEGENEEVEDARILFARVRQDLLGLRQEALEVQKCLGMTLQRSGTGLLGSGSLRGGAELHAFTVPASVIAAAAAAVSGNQSGQVQSGGATTAAAGAGGAAAPAVIEDAGHVSLTASADSLPVLTALREHLAGEALAVAAAAAAGAGAESGAAGVLSSSISQPNSPGPTILSNRGTTTTSIPHQQNSSHHMASTFQRRQSIDARRDQLTLLLRWVHEKEAAAADDYTRTKTTLLELKNAAGKQQVSRAASRVLVQLDRIVWQLCTPERLPFVQAALRGLTFDTHRNRDLSGSAKFIIHRVDIIDATGNLSEGPATPPGVILACWNPDSSYEREPVLRVVTTMGVPTRTHTVFEHLDASLHPLSLHLTESIAVACWEYFFPKEDSRSRQEAFTQSVGNSTTGGGNAGAGGGRGRRGSSAVIDAPAGGGGAGGGESPMAGTSPLASGRSSFADYPGSPPAAMGGGNNNPALRNQLVGAGGGSGGTGAGVQRSLLLGDMVNEDGTSVLFGGPSGGSTPSAAASAAATSRGPFRGGAGSANTAAGAGAGGGSKREKQQQQQQQHGGRTRKRFVYVKLNRAHMRITYQGYPIGIKDRILVINSYTCENLDGRWRDLLANVKQKAILSAVWSGLGLQGRKIRELMDGAAPAVPHHGQSGLPGEDGRGAKGLLAKMGLAPKSRKGGDGAVAGAPEMSQEELKALSKKRALFGNHVMKNMGGPLRSGMPASTPATTTYGASTSAAATATAAINAGAGGAGTKSAGTSAGASPSNSSASSPRASVLHSEKQQSGEHPHHGPSKDTLAPPSSPFNTTTTTTNTTASAAAAAVVSSIPSRVSSDIHRSQSNTQQRQAVPVLDLQRPLPPEEPSDAVGSGQHREVSLSPLEAGIVAVSTGRGLLNSPGRSSSSATSSPTKKFSLGRGDSSGTGSGGGTDPVAALLGQAFQQQTQQHQHGPRHEDDAAAQLLGIPSPRKEGASSGGGVGKTAKNWISKMTHHK